MVCEVGRYVVYDVWNVVCGTGDVICMWSVVCCVHGTYEMFVCCV